MSSDNIRIATITASYNTGKYFPEFLDGLLSQSRKPNYIVVVDDNSSDGSRFSMQEYLDRLTKTNSGSDWATISEKNNCRLKQWNKNGVDITLFGHSSNRGPAAARNTALKYILDKVGVIFVADADDVYYKDKIEKSIDVLKSDNRVGLVYSDYDIYNEQTGSLTREFKEPFSYNRLFSECIVSNNSAIVSNAIRLVGLYDESLRGPEDYDLWLRLSEKSLVYHIPESLYKYRISGNNITITTPKEKFAEHVHRVHQKAIQRNSQQ
jgi:glycosyltransferase involved in cell wall biosynthesis